MLFILSLLSSFGIIGTIIFGISLRKYQTRFYEESIKKNKSMDEMSNVLKDKEMIIKDNQEQLDFLEKKITENDRELHNFTTNNVAKNEDSTNDDQENIKLRDQFEQISFQNKELKEELEVLKRRNDEEYQEVGQQNNQNIINNIKIFKQQNQEALNIERDFSKLQFAYDQTLPEEIFFEKIMDALSLQLEKDCSYVVSEENPDQLDYIIISNYTGEAFLIDVKFSYFLMENKNNLVESGQELSDILNDRVNFFYNAKDEIITVLAQMEDFRGVNQLHNCIYIPSENLVSMLKKSDPDFFKHSQEKDMMILSSAGAVNLLSQTKYNKLLSKNNSNFTLIENLLTGEGADDAGMLTDDFVADEGQDMKKEDISENMEISGDDVVADEGQDMKKEDISANMEMSDDNVVADEGQDMKKEDISANMKMSDDDVVADEGQDMKKEDISANMEISGDDVVADEGQDMKKEDISANMEMSGDNVVADEGQDMKKEDISANMEMSDDDFVADEEQDMKKEDISANMKMSDDDFVADEEQDMKKEDISANMEMSDDDFVADEEQNMQKEDLDANMKISYDDSVANEEQDMKEDDLDANMAISEDNIEQKISNEDLNYMLDENLDNQNLKDLDKEQDDTSSNNPKKDEEDDDFNIEDFLNEKNT